MIKRYSDLCGTPINNYKQMYHKAYFDTDRGRVFAMSSSTMCRASGSSAQEVCEKCLILLISKGSSTEMPVIDIRCKKE